jgi:hypothetical protein
MSLSWVLASLLAGIWFYGPPIVQAQQPAKKAPAADVKKAPAAKYTAKLTSWGDPDLQGVWSN